MSKIYIVRHQAWGMVHEFPFAQPPSDEQLSAIGRMCFQRHGASHPKTPETPFWTRIVEVELLGPSDVPDVPERALSLSKDNTAAESQIGISGVGAVTPAGA